MDSQKIVSELKQTYPDKNIVQIPSENPTEILCEIDPSPQHPDYSVVIAVIDQSRPHYHRRSMERYEVLRGDLILTINGKDYSLKAGEQMTITPNQIHWAEGSGTWARVTSHPGWTIQDHILVDENQMAVSTYDKIAKIYTDKYSNDTTDTPFIDTFTSYLPKGAHILDVGSGPGQFTKYLLEKGYDVEGIDLSDEMLRIAQRKVPKTTFTKMDMRHLAFKKESFDGLLVAYALIHIPTPDLQETLKGFYRVLKPKGYALFITQKGKPDQIIDEAFKPNEKMFINFFTKERLRRLLEKAGFNLIFQEEHTSQDQNSMSDMIIYTVAKKYER